MTNGKLIRSGFAFIKRAKGITLNKFAYWIKESTRSGPTRHFIYGRNKITSNIDDIERLRNWRTLETSAIDFSSTPLNDLYSKNEKSNVGTEVLPSETELDETNIFDIDRSETSDSDDDAESEDEDEDVDADKEADDDDDEEEITEAINEPQSPAADAPNDADASSASDSGGDDTPIAGDVRRPDRTRYGISTDLGLTFLFWRYW